jgi:xylulokinase
VHLVAGVDSSTGAVEVEVRDADDGRVVATGRAADLDAALAAAGSPEVAVISATGSLGGCVALDAAGRPVGVDPGWSDQATAPDAGWLTGQLPDGAAAWAQAVGSAPAPWSAIAKLSFLHRSRPDDWSQVARVGVPHDLLTLGLTGDLVTDRGAASSTGYWSPVAERYRFDLLSIVDFELDWPAMVPAVLGPIDPAGHWRDAVVGPGTLDLMAIALAVGAAPGDVVVVLSGERGASTASVVAEAPSTDRTGRVASLADATGRYLPTIRLDDGDGPDHVRAAVELLGAHARLDGERWWLSGEPGAVAAHRDALVAGAGCPVVVVPGRLAAAGACIQAAAVLHRRPPEDVQAAWRAAGTLAGSA